MPRTCAGRLLSVNVGLPGDVDWHGRTVHTAVWKRAVSGRRMVRRLNIDGDGQGDRIGHGGEQRAVLVYQVASYRYWERVLDRSDFVYGQFGENFTVDGLADDEVCIGDRYRIGGAVFEVTQPRVTCYRVGIRMNEPRMAALLVSHRRPGEEGEVEAGADIVKLASGAERMSVVEADALLYLPGHRAEALQRALRIPAFSPGWKASFQALLEQSLGTVKTGGNPGLAPTDVSLTPLAWRGFRRVRVAAKRRESVDVISLLLESADAQPLALPLAGQFIVMRLTPNREAPPLIRSYSLSGAPDVRQYRVSIKCEVGGTAGTYIDRAVGPGDLLEVSAPRGGFTLTDGDRPLVLASAGIGITPVLAMLHRLADERSTRQIWWLFGARDGRHQPFAAESRALLRLLPNAHSRIWYSRPSAGDRRGADFDAAGHMTVESFETLNVPRDADFYLCGPAGFMHALRSGLADRGVAGMRLHGETFGPGESLTPGIVNPHHRPVHPPADPARDGPLVSFARSRLAVRWDGRFQSLLELAEACDVPVRWSCRAGVCHACESGLVGGAVDYRPDPVECPAEGNLLICCSRPRGDVVIDL